MIFDTSTVTANVADRTASTWLTVGDAGRVYAGAPISVTNSVIAGNSAPSGVKPDAAGTLRSGGHNLIGDSTGVTLTGNLDGNVLDVAARLGPLSADGGLPIHPLLPGSPAIDAGSPLAPGSSPFACAPADARGVLRPQDGDGDGVAVCDIGAAEAVAITVPETPTATSTLTPSATPPVLATATTTPTAIATNTPMPTESPPATASSTRTPPAAPWRVYLPAIRYHVLTLR